MNLLFIFLSFIMNCISLVGGIVFTKYAFETEKHSFTVDGQTCLRDMDVPWGNDLRWVRSTVVISAIAAVYNTILLIFTFHGKDSVSSAYPGVIKILSFLTGLSIVIPVYLFDVVFSDLRLTHWKTDESGKRVACSPGETCTRDPGVCFSYFDKNRINLLRFTAIAWMVSTAGQMVMSILPSLIKKVPGSTINRGMMYR